MKIRFEKRRRIAEIFGRISEYTVSILILGGIIAGKMSLALIVTGIILFSVFLFISVTAEPEKEEM